MTSFRLYCRAQLSLLRDALDLLRRPGDGSLGVVTVLAIASGLCPVALVYVTRGVVDRLVAAVNSGGERTAVVALMFWAAAVGTLLLLSQVLSAALDWKRTVHAERLKEHITERVHRQSVRLDLSFYETPDFFDRLHRAREEAGYRPAELCRAFVEVLQGIVVFVGLGAVLLTLGPWLLAGLFLAALPMMYVVSKHATTYQRWWISVTQDERRAWYYDSVLTTTEHAAELRLFGTGGSFRARHRLLRTRLREGLLNLIWRRTVAEAIAAAGSVAVMGTAVAWMAWRAIQGLATLGQLAAFYQALSSGLTTMRSLLSGVARVHSNALFIRSLFEFLALEPRIVSPASPVTMAPRIQRGIRFRNVTFSYPGSSHLALDRFNLHIVAGRTAAIVGPNGAGKSTLLKLMCRLYDPLDGAIEVDGIDIRRIDLRYLRALVSALFQPPGRYQESADTNIRLGSSESISAIDIARASRAAAADFVERLPNGYNTNLGKAFDAHGTELSAGQWQRLAVARSLARPSQILLLDEPTSALDPWDEREWYPRIRSAAADRTILITTHRLATAKQADEIHVMENGRIIESGTHCELIAKNGRYASCAAGAGETMFTQMELVRS